MSKEKCKVEVKSWNRFKISSFAVEPEVLGNEHCFPFLDATVTVKIPTIDKVDRGKNYDNVATVGWRADNNEPIDFRIYKVDVEVSIPVAAVLPEEALNRHPNAVDLFSQAEQNSLMKIAERHEDIAEKSFEYWVRMLRWLRDDSRIGRYEVGSFHSGWSTYLVNAETNKRFWASGQTFYAIGYKALNVGDWEKLQVELSKGTQPPIHMEFKLDAEERIKLGDYNRSLVDMAIACETFLRFVVFQHLPKELNSKLTEYIEEANISQYMNKFFPKVLDEATNKQFNKIKSNLFSLFERRNKLVHLGKSQGIDEQLCRKFLKTTQMLLSMEIV
jgi:hypothetical protein